SEQQPCGRASVPQSARHCQQQETQSPAAGILYGGWAGTQGSSGGEGSILNVRFASKAYKIGPKSNFRSYATAASGRIADIRLAPYSCDAGNYCNEVSSAHRSVALMCAA